MRASFCLVRQAKPKSRWADPSVQEFHPHWVVKYYLAGRRMKESGNSLLPFHADICPACLAAVKPDPGCRCQAPLRKAAEQWLVRWKRTAARLALERRMEELDQLLSPVRQVRFGKVIEAYLNHGPRDAKPRVAALRCIVEETTGQRLEETEVAAFNQKLVRQWVRLRQEHYRRGWSRNRSRKAPSNAWTVLRRELAAGSLPELDKRTGMEVNTTIRSYLNKAKSVMGKLSRAEYLGDLAASLPPVDQVEGILVDLVVPRGKQMDVDAYAAILKAAEGLKKSDPQLWLAWELARRLGLRTIELRHLRRHWFEVDDLGRAFVVIKNRPEEGFQVKAWKRDLERPLEVGPEIMEVIERVQCVEVGTGFVSVLGTPSPTAAAKVMKRLSKFIRQFVPEGSQTIYLCRKMVISQRAALHGMAEAQAGAGHAMGSSVTGTHYLNQRAAPVRALTDAELSPEAIRGARRRRMSDEGAA